MRTLNLFHNNITEIRCLEDLQDLEELHLHFNKIQRILHIKGPKELKTLRLNNNRLDHLLDLKNVQGVGVFIADNPIEKEIEGKCQHFITCERSINWSLFSDHW